MTPEQTVAYIIAMSACANARVAGMVAENQIRSAQGEPMLYGEGDFEAITLQYGIHHNAVIGYFTGR